MTSVQQQSLENYEHIIVDDCSSDETESLVRQVKDSRIRYVRLPHWQGANVARNVGIEKARAAILSFLDSDDEFKPHRLESIETVMRMRPDVQLILSSFQCAKKNRVLMAANLAAELSQQQLELALMSHTIFIGGTSISVRKDILIRAGMFQPKIRRLQDREALLRLSQHCGALLLQAIDWVKHVSDDSISRNPLGFVRSMGEMLDVHPTLNENYGSLVHYHVARHVLKDLLHGRLRNARLSLQENQAAESLRISFSKLVIGYHKGSAIRKHAKGSLGKPTSPVPN
jgi:glycosyltransferase involved in cell wall biosynthesis